MLTASRLASEKHVDWIAKAVIKAKRKCQLTFDIYGHGNERSKLKKSLKKMKHKIIFNLKVIRS